MHDDPKYSASSIYHLSLGNGVASRSQSKYDVKSASKTLGRSSENFYAATDIVKVIRKDIILICSSNIDPPGLVRP